MKFVKNPNLPINAGGVIISPHTSDNIVEALENLKITPIPGFSSIQPVSGICGHPDTNIIHLGENTFLCSPNAYGYYKKAFEDSDINLLKGNLSGEGEYPADVAYNAAILNNFCIHNLKFSDSIISNYNFTKINVNQGYCKCSVCVVNENSIITDDAGIFTACKSQKIDSLLVSKGDVMLSGVNYGFVGGCSGLLAKNLLAFTGDISLHRDYKEIKKFCDKKNVEILPLTRGPLIDIGSILPIFEKTHTNF